MIKKIIEYKVVPFVLIVDSGNGTPVMNYSAGWFSTTCNVFCDQ